MRRKRKAQLQIGENVIVLIIFFFLLVIAVVFYAGIQKSKFSAKQKEIESFPLLDMKTLVGAMPEIMCTENSDVTESCIDIINLEAMANFWSSINNSRTSREWEYYNQRFAYSKIVIKRLDVIQGNWTGEWTLYNNVPENFSSGRPAFIPVSLYNATRGTYDFGYIELTRYTR